MRLKMWLALMCLLAFLKPLDVAVAVTPTPTSTDMPSEVGADSVTYQIDAAHSGSLSGSNLRPPLKQLWSKEMEGTVLNPVVVGGTVYVVVRDHDKGPDERYGSNLYALDSATGAIIWGPVPLGGPWWGADLAYEDGQLFTRTYDGLLRAYDAQTSTLRWQRSSSDSDSGGVPLTPYKGRIYLGNNGNVVAIDEANGETAWTSHVNGLDAVPAVSNLGVFVSFTTGRNYRLDLETGKIIWQHDSKWWSGGEGTPPVLYNGQLYTSLDELGVGESYSFDPENGARIKSFTADPAPAFDGDFGFYLFEGKLQGVNERFGQTIWWFRGDNALNLAPIVVNKVVYVASTKGKLYGLARSTGKIVYEGILPSGVRARNEYTSRFIGLAAGRDTLMVPASNFLVAFGTDEAEASRLMSQGATLLNSAAHTLSSTSRFVSLMLCGGCR